MDEETRRRPRAAEVEAPYPLLGSAPSTRPSRLAGFGVDRARLLAVGAVVVLAVAGSLLPYLSMPYITYSVELAQKHDTLFPAAQFIRGADPQWLPGYQPGPSTDAKMFALNVFNLGTSMQQIGVVVALLACWSLFQNEINKFFWWPFHLSGWALSLSPLPLFIGLQMLHRSGLSVTLGPGWVPLTLAGVVILVATFRARDRIDTYASI